MTSTTFTVGYQYDFDSNLFPLIYPDGSVDISGAVSGLASGAMIYELATPSTSDRLFVSSTGSLSIGSGVLEFDDFNFSTLTGFGSGTYVLWDTHSPITGTLGTNLSGNVGALSSTLALANGANDLVLNVVPEPSSLALGIASLGLLTRRRRRA